MTADLVIRGATIFDGRGGVPTAGDVLVDDGRVIEVGRLADVQANETIDASGMALAPGFIDLHGHSDVAVLLEPSAESMIQQGVTLQLVGNCGASMFPLPGDVPSPKFDPEGISASWSTADEYFDRVSGAGPDINVASLVGFGTLKRSVTGETPRRMTASELRTLSALTDQALESGAMGVSLGLHFEPDLWAGPDELQTVARVAAAADGLVAIHLRDYGERLARALDEAIRLAARTGARTLVSLLHAFGRSAHGSIPEAIEKLDNARDRGIDVSCEAVLWSTVGAWDGLRATLPTDVYDWQAPDWKSITNLARSEPDVLAQLLEARRTSTKIGFYEEYMIFGSWGDLRLVHAPETSQFADLVGLDLNEGGLRRGIDPAALYVSMLADDPQELFILHSVLDDDDVLACVQWPHAYLGIDAVATSLARAGEPWNTMQHHPRHFASTARLLGHVARDAGTLPLEEAIRRMTSGPATVMGQSDRGVIAPGCVADLVLFRPEEVAPAGGWRDPRRRPAGFDEVFVNGRRQGVASRGGVVRRKSGPST